MPLAEIETAIVNRCWEPDLAATLSAAGVGYLPLDDYHFLRAGLSPEELDGVYLTEAGGAPVRAGRVKLEIPPLIDNGNAVPMAVSVESPMTEADHVKAIHLFTEKNPQPNIISVHLNPRSGKAAISTRIRLADTQTVTAIAEMSDGSFWQDTGDVIITLGACLEDPV